MGQHHHAKGALVDEQRFQWLDGAALASAALVAGALLRLLAVGRFEPNIDAYWYAVDAGTSFAEIWTGMPDGAIPRTPVYASAIRLTYLLVGDLALALQVTSLVTSIAALVVVYVCTRDLWGSTAALGTSALVALDPLILSLTGWGYSFNMALLLFTLTLWAIMRSLEQPPFITLAGVFAAIAYLTRSSLGVFFLIAAGMGVVWRLVFAGEGKADSGAAFDRWYVLGGAIFATTVLVWNLHNYALAGRFSANPGVAEASTAPLMAPWSYLGIFGLQLLYLGTAAAVYAGFFPDEIKASLKRALDSELESGLWTAVLSVIVTSAAITAGLWFFEESPIFRTDHVRYAGLAIVPVGWIVLRNDEAETAGDNSPWARAGSAAFFGVMTVLSRAWLLAVGVFQALKGRTRRQRLLVLGAGLAIVSIATLVVVAPASTHPARTQALETLDERASPGDTLYVQADEGRLGARSLKVKPDMVEVKAPGVALVESMDARPDWVIRWDPWSTQSNPGYALVAHHQDAEGVSAQLVGTLDPLGVRNAETFVYERCPPVGADLVDLGPVLDRSACA